MIYIVLGMHKSGTTLISQILHKSGINMGEFDESVRYDEGNQYERKECQNINNDMLHSHGKYCLDVVNDSAVGNYQKEKPHIIPRLLINLNKQYHDWGFKDPRTCLTYALWKKYLSEHKLIFVYRHPLEVWRHFDNFIPWYKIHTKIIVCWKAVAAWYIYNSKIAEQIKKKESIYTIIDYNEFMDFSETIRQLESFVGMHLMDCRQKEMYRTKQKSTLLFDVVKRIYFFVTKNDIDALYLKLLSEYKKQNNV